MDDVMEPRDYIQPSTYDVLLSDVKHDDLIGPIAQRLDVTYLSDSESTIISKTIGILYGTNCRPIVSLSIASTKFKKFVNVIFLIDTGSPCLYICQQAMEALGFNDNITETFDITCQGMSFEAVMSPLKQRDGRDGHYSDINLIGATFLSKSRAKLSVDYKLNLVELEFN